MPETGGQTSKGEQEEMLPGETIVAAMLEAVRHINTALMRMLC